MNRTATSLFWWAATLVTLIVVDDLTYGPVFWLATRLGPTAIVVVVTFSIYWVAQVLIVRESTSETPHRVASFILDRLQLTRKNDEIHKREQSLLSRVTGATVAVPLSLVIGGILPVLLLFRAGRPVDSVRRLSLLTSAVYAAEFAYLHAYLPSVII